MTAAGDGPVTPAGRHVTVELDSGPYEMEFSYQPIGQPRYGDVPSLIGTFDSENDAELAGARMLSIGNWRSFTVQKRYAHPRPAARGDQP